MRSILWFLALVPCFLWIVFFVVCTASAVFAAVVNDSLSTSLVGMCCGTCVWGGMHVMMFVCRRLDAAFTAEVE